jgi:hypothetical protein
MVQTPSPTSTPPATIFQHYFDAFFEWQGEEAVGVSAAIPSHPSLSRP